MSMTRKLYVLRVSSRIRQATPGEPEHMGRWLTCRTDALGRPVIEARHELSRGHEEHLCASGPHTQACARQPDLALGGVRGQDLLDDVDLARGKLLGLVAALLLGRGSHDENIPGYDWSGLNSDSLELFWSSVGISGKYEMREKEAKQGDYSFSTRPNLLVAVPGLFCAAGWLASSGGHTDTLRC